MRLLGANIPHAASAVLPERLVQTKGFISSPYFDFKTIREDLDRLVETMGCEPIRYGFGIALREAGDRNGTSGAMTGRSDGSRARRYEDDHWPLCPRNAGRRGKLLTARNTST